MNTLSMDKDLIAAGFVSTEPKKGLTVLTAIFFIVGEIAGTGILALPHAMANTGWTGIGIIVGSGLIVSYTGLCLARSWMIMEERWPEYRSHTRNPFAEIGLRSFGKWMSYVCSAVMQVNFFGGCVVYLLLCSELVQGLTSSWAKSITFCDWILILALLLLPFSLFGSPADFWLFALGAIATTFFALILLIFQIGKEAASHSQSTGEAEPTFYSFFLGLGVMVATYGGLAAFPTFQNDMKDKSKFPLAVVLALALITCLYLTISIPGYIVFGSKVDDNVVNTISDGWPKTSIAILLASHLFLAFLIIMNPVAQEFESFVNIPRHFTYKRILTRSLLMVGIVFCALTVPKFGKLLSLVGGSAISLQVFVLPPLFYMKLVKDQDLDDEWPRRHISLGIKIFLYCSIVIGLVAGLSSTISAVYDIVSPDSFQPPCYISAKSFCK